MSLNKLDCRDMACPMPVLKTKEALEKEDEIILDVELNSYSSIENVKRFVKSRGLYFEEKIIERGHVILSIVKGYECTLEPGKKDRYKEIPPPPSDSLRAEQIMQASKEAKENRSFYTLLWGGIISAILASTCCLGPLLFLLFGISAGSLSFLKALAPYHNIFTAAALLVIGWLWLDYFRKQKDALVCSTALCKNYKLYLIIGTVFVAVMLTYPWWVVYIIPGD